MSYIDHQYINTLRELYAKGSEVYPDRTGTGRIKSFAKHMFFDLSKGFPMDTTRQVFAGVLKKELLGFVHGQVRLEQLGGIWDKWVPTKEDAHAFLKKQFHEDDINAVGIDRLIQDLGLDQRVGTIGPMYGAQWRYGPNSPSNFPSPQRPYKDLPKDKKAFVAMAHNQQQDEMFLEKSAEVRQRDLELATQHYYHQSYDQLWEAFLTLRDDPWSSRIVMSSWQTHVLPYNGVSPQENVLMGKGALAPCHVYVQWLCEKDADGQIVVNCHMTQRSADYPVGIPYNVMQYALLTSMLCHVLKYKVGKLSILTVDSHIYANQLEGLAIQTTREPLPFPTLWLNPEVTDLFDFTPDDIKIEGYQHSGRIDYPVAV